MADSSAKSASIIRPMATSVFTLAALILLIDAIILLMDAPIIACCCVIVCRIDIDVSNVVVAAAAVDKSTDKGNIVDSVAPGVIATVKVSEAFGPAWIVYGGPPNAPFTT